VDALFQAPLIWIDYVIVGLVVLSAVIGLFRGFVREAFSLLIWFVAAWVAYTYSQAFSLYLLDYIDVPSVRVAAAFVILLVTTLILGALLSFLIQQLIEKTGLTGTDRFAGCLFGIARGGVVVAVLVLLGGLTPMPQDPWWNASVLIGPFQDFAIWLHSQLPAGMATYLSY